MASIYFDRDTYKAGETATITYEGASSRSSIRIINPSRRIARYWSAVSGSGSVNWAIPADAEIGNYSLYLYDGDTPVAHDTASITGGAPPTEPPPTGFTDTGEVTPATIEVSPATYDVMFKLTGYKDKIILNVMVSEGATKPVSATLEPEVAPPITKTVTFVSVPTGASVNVVKM